MLAELLGPVLRWPLHSPRRLGLVLAGLITALLLVAALTSPGGDAPPGGATAPVVPTTEPSGPHTEHTTPVPAGTAWLEDLASPDPSDQTGTDGEVDADADADAGQVAAASAAAVAFVTAWARPDLAPEMWLAGLVDVTDPAYLERLTTTDPANVPATAVTGPVEPIVTGAFYSEFLVPTDAGDLTVRVTYDGAGWRVVSIRPVGQPGEGG